MKTAINEPVKASIINDALFIRFVHAALEGHRDVMIRTPLVMHVHVARRGYASHLSVVGIRYEPATSPSGEAQVSAIVKSGRGYTVDLPLHREHGRLYISIVLPVR